MGKFTMEKALFDAMSVRTDLFTHKNVYNQPPKPGETRYNPYGDLWQAINAHPENTDEILVEVFEQLDRKLTNDGDGIKEALAIRALTIGVKSGWVSDVVNAHAKSADVTIDVEYATSIVTVTPNTIGGSGNVSTQSLSQQRFDAANEITDHIIKEAERFIKTTIQQQDQTR